MWRSRTKDDLIIEVWEKLDCENIGAVEIEAIQIAVAGEYGEQAVDSPMIIARLLADEGAELRHSEIMDLYVRKASVRLYDAAVRNVLNLGSLRSAAGSIKKLENLRRHYAADNDREGTRIVRDVALQAKDHAAATAAKTTDQATGFANLEIAEWFTLWLQNPAIFDNWLALRLRSSDFIDKFGNIEEDGN